MDLASTDQPSMMSSLHGDWAAWLLSTGRTEEAVHHLMEAGDSTAAVEAALSAQLFERAEAILEKRVVSALSALTLYCTYWSTQD